jgi:hypothetical protein
VPGRFASKWNDSHATITVGSSAGVPLTHACSSVTLAPVFSLGLSWCVHAGLARGLAVGLLPHTKPESQVRG